ncbi:hypothetical protein ACEPAF_4892 [Sanghuangporus sanghuang]
MSTWRRCSGSYPSPSSCSSFQSIAATSNRVLIQTSNTKSYAVNLPPEIWLHVFEILAYIPGILSLSDERAIEAFSEDGNGVILQGLYADIMKTKLAIGQVSWTWRKLILPLLFEFVVVKSGRHALEIASTLARLKREQLEKDYYGRWIKRVEVLVSDKCWEQDSADALVRILELAPNTMVFSDLFCFGALPQDSIPSIISTLQGLSESRQLRRIDSSGGIIYRLSLLSNMPSLEVLVTSQAITTPMILPKLHTLSIANSEVVLAHGLGNLVAPNLQSLITRDKTARTSTAVKVYLHSNSSLSVSLKHLRWAPPRHTKTTQQLKKLRLNIADMPELTSLTVDIGTLPSLGSFENFRIKHQTLQRIVFDNFPTFGTRMHLGHYLQGRRILSGFLHSLLKVEDNPSLQTIGFLRYQSYFETGNFSTHSRPWEGGVNITLWRDFLAACKERGITVEASVGAKNHFYGSWQPFHLGLVPRACTSKNLRADLF